MAIVIFSISNVKYKNSRDLKDVRARIFQSIDFFKCLLQSDNVLQRVESYPDYEKFAHVIQHVVRNIRTKQENQNEQK